MAAETELTIYAKIDHFPGLKQADHIEDQIQLDSEYWNGGRVRCRMTRLPNNSIVYMLTQKSPIKSQIAGVRATDETNAVIDEEFFNSFKANCKKIVKKTRCVFPVEKITIYFENGGQPIELRTPLKYEVDVFLMRNDALSEWCKIDIELDQAIKDLKQQFPNVSTDALKKIRVKISDLPFKPSQFIVSSTNVPEEKKFLSDLWDNEFNYWEHKKNAGDT